MGWGVGVEFGLAVVTFGVLWVVTAPYGRHGRAGWGPTVPARVAWVVMESPAALVFAGVYATGPHRTQVGALVLLGMWEAHYLYRAYLYPFLARGGARMPVLVVGLAICFNTLNAGLNARWVSAHGDYPAAWLADPRFVVGAILFAGGLAMHVRADATLRGLRGPGERGYRVPYGGGYRFVSSPNYLGEIVEWAGWALASWSPAGAAFAVYTVANLAPRAADHHRWYRERFPDYPATRRALVPYVW